MNLNKCVSVCERGGMALFFFSFGLHAPQAFHHKGSATVGDSIYTACSTQLCLSLLSDEEQVAGLTWSGAAIQGRAESFPFPLSGPWCATRGLCVSSSFSEGQAGNWAASQGVAVVTCGCLVAQP